MLPLNGAQTLSKAIETYGGTLIDALSIIKAIQSGDPLPIAVSGLRLANDISNLADLPNYNLSGAASVGSSILSILSLEQALQRGDTLAAVTAGAQAISFGAQAYANFATGWDGGKAIQAAFGADSAISQLNEALPYLNLVNSIAHGDAIGVAVAVTDMVLMDAAVYSVPYIGWAYAAYSMISSLFGDEDPPPEPWGSAAAGWSGFSAVANAAGEHGGYEAAQGTLNQFIAQLNSLAAYEQSVNPGSAIGVIANRLPSLSYRNYTGFQLTDIDPITGVQRNPEIKYDLTGRPYNAPPGSDQASQSLSERFIRVALARGAVAPMWEVQTAAIQTQHGDPQAGLTEEERAGRNGQLSTQDSGLSTQVFRAVALDLNGDGVQTTGAARTVAFDVDDSGFMKNTAWLNNNDGFLFLDRNLNGSIDSGRELFSNSIVDLSARGLAGMRWIDSNYDGKLTTADPVWNELKIWQDANGDGQADAGEVKGLSDLGITALDYAMGRFEQNGQLKEMSSPDLAADTAGTRTHVVPEGIVVETTSGHTSLLVTRIDDRTVIEANRDGITSYEDIEAIVSTADLMANDMLGGFVGSNLSVTGVSNFTHGTGWLDGNGFVHYNPAANYYGPASFNYTIQAPTGQTATATVDINLQNVNDAPTATVDQHVRAIYGYASFDTVWNDWGGTSTPSNPQYSPYYGYDYSSPDYWQSYGYHTTPVSYEDPDGPNVATVVVSDIDDPNGPFNYQVSAQPQMGSASIDANGNIQYTNWYGPNTPGAASDGSNYDPTFDTFIPTYSTQSDPFTVRVTDPHGASTTIQVNSVHEGAYYPSLGSGGGGKKPISIDLGNDGFAFTNVDDSNIFFDINGDGFKHRTAWPSAGNGLLAYDADGNGKIEHAGEISFAGYKNGAQTDLEGLKEFDTNGDGVFSAADDKWSKFGVWQDANQNGITDPGEFRTLADMGVASIALTSDGQFSIINGQTVHGVGTVTKTDGSTLNLADVTLEYSNDVLVTKADDTSQVVSQTPFSPSGEELNGTDGNDLILGKTGNNIINAGAGDDVVMEDGGNDFIDGGDGNDTIYAGADTDLVIAGAGDDVVFAGLANDMLLGGDGHDALFGEGGNDVIFGGKGNDLVSGDSGNDVLSGDAGDDQVYGGSGNDALFGGAGNDELAGMDGYDRLDGGTGNDLLDGGADADEMIGGAGDDIYVVDNPLRLGSGQAQGDVVTENPDEGIDTVRSSISYTLGANLENLTLTGTENLTGAGNDADNVLIGNAGNNTLTAGSGNDTLDGGMGADTLIGGTGDDVYVGDNAADIVFERPDEGTDTILSSVSYALTDNVENLALTGRSAIDATGNALDNVITGNLANNVLDGGAGNDAMAGGRGNDTYVVDNIGDLTIELANEGVDTVVSSLSWTLDGNIENLTLTEMADLSGTGNGLDNVLAGNAGNNRIDGGLGVDTMAGGAGDDTYIVDNTADVVIEQLKEGNDSVFASASYTLSASVENLTLTGTADIDGSGNALDNVIAGNSGNNVLDGGAGADTMAGGAGDDTYIVDNPSTGSGQAQGDTVTEQYGGGVDTVLSSVSYSLSANVENLTLTGTENLSGTGNGLGNVLVGNAGNNELLGEAGNDTLIGNCGNDLLDGGAGADAMAGGAGDDTYIVDNVGDAVMELASEGIDTVYSSIDYTLGANVENLTLTGMDNLSGTGNELDNILLGNAGNNLIDGDAGADSMAGGLGDDAYIVDNAGDLVVEQFNEGLDHVYSSISYVLPQHVENLTLTGPSTSSGQASAIDGTGNGLDNIIVGNAASNVLDGAAGADTLIGGAGDDTYIVDNAGDQTVELAGEGIDTVYSSVSWALAGNVENLTLTGTNTIDGSGNELDNIIIGNGADNRLIGNAGNDSLFGNAGNDVLDGGTDNDILYGGVGDDTYIWRKGDGLDTIADMGGNDTVRFGDALNLDNLALRVTSENGIYTAHVRALDDCGCEMDGQGFDFAVGVDANGGYVSPIEQFRLADGTQLTFDDLLIKTVVTLVRPGREADHDEDGHHGNEGRGRIPSGKGGHDSGFGEDKHEENDSRLKQIRLTDGSRLHLDDLPGGTLVAIASPRNRTVVTGRNDDIILGSANSETIRAGTGNDIVFASAGRDALYGEGGNDALLGGNGADTLIGGCGYDILAGGEGKDILIAGDENNLLLGGNGNDRILAGAGNDFIAGGRGDDTIVTGAGNNTVAFNREDGRDTILAYAGARNTLSLGGDLEFRDLGFMRSGNDLVLDARHHDAITFKDWYASPDNRTFFTLQTIEEKSDDWDDWRHALPYKHAFVTHHMIEETGADTLYDKKVERFDFQKLADSFDQARAANPGLTRWNLMNGLLDAHLGGSDNAALGGEFAYEYGQSGSLAQAGISAAQTALKDPGFGGLQTLKPFQGLTAEIAIGR
ncbi:MAG: Ig-like domain-containing protein [Sulfuricella sp.]